MGWSHLMVKLVTPVDWDKLEKSPDKGKTAQKCKTTAALVRYLNVGKIVQNRTAVASAKTPVKTGC